MGKWKTFQAKAKARPCMARLDCQQCRARVDRRRPKKTNEKKDIHLKILTTTTNSYKFEYGYVGDTNKRLGEAILMN